MTRLMSGMAVALCLVLPVPAHADAINNLSLSIIPDASVVPQSLSRPCIICATTQAHNPVGFGYNNFDSTGNTSSFNLFSSNITGSFGNGDDITVTPYTSGELRNFLQSVGDLSFKFAVAIDINTTGAKSEYLELFQLINLDGDPGQRVIFDLRNVALPGINNGNGAADYLISGFDLSSVDPGDRLLFRAQWSGAVDGGESFYIVPDVTVVPAPSLGSGLVGLLMLSGLVGWHRLRRQA